jgi:hypothetical protein
MLQFLAINGWDIDPAPPGPVAAMVAGLAAGTVSTRDAAALLAPRLRPSDQHNRRGHDDHPKEAPMRPRPALPLTGKFRARPRPALRLADRTKFALLDPRRTRVYPRGFTGRHKQAVDLSLEEAAAALQDREDQLRADKLRLEQQRTAGVDVQAVVAENQRMHRELDRMRGLLREHGTEPDNGTARTA